MAARAGVFLGAPKEKLGADGLVSSCFAPKLKPLAGAGVDAGVAAGAPNENDGFAGSETAGAGVGVADGAPKENEGVSFLAGAALDPNEKPLDVALDEGVDEVSRLLFNFGAGLGSFAGVGAPNENDGLGASVLAGCDAGAPNENVGASCLASVDAVD